MNNRRAGSQPAFHPLSNWVNEESSVVDAVALLDDPDLPLTELFKSTNLMQIFREKNPVVEEYLHQPIIIDEMFDIIKSSEEVPHMQIIMSLFNSTNQSLLKLFADEPNILERIVDILELEENGSLYRIGLITQLLANTVTAWPSDALQNYCASPVLFPTLLSLLNYDSIFVCLLQIAQTQPVWFHHYLWGFIIGLIGDKGLPKHPQSWNVKLPGVINCKDVNMVPIIRERVFKIFAKFSAVFTDETDFRTSLSQLIPKFMSVISTTEEKNALYQMALKVPPSNFLISHSFQIFKNLDDVPLQELESAVSYITYAYEGTEIEQIIHFIYNVFDRGVENVFIGKAIIDLITSTVDNFVYPRFLGKVFQHVVAIIWNRETEKSILENALLLQISAIVGDSPSWDGWEDFQNTVVESFSQSKEFPRDFMISIDNWDQDMVNKLQNPNSVIEMTPADKMFISMSFMNDELSGSESQSAESGSYHTEYEEEEIRIGEYYNTEPVQAMSIVPQSKKTSKFNSENVVPPKNDETKETPEEPENEDENENEETHKEEQEHKHEEEDTENNLNNTNNIEEAHDKNRKSKRNQKKDKRNNDEKCAVQ